MVSVAITKKIPSFLALIKGQHIDGWFQLFFFCLSVICLVASNLLAVDYFLDVSVIAVIRVNDMILVSSFFF